MFKKFFKLLDKSAEIYILLRQNEVLKDKIDVYEKFFHQINLHLSCTLKHERVKEALEIIDSWSYSFRQGNGERTEEEEESAIKYQFERMRNFK